MWNFNPLNLFAVSKMIYKLSVAQDHNSRGCAIAGTRPEFISKSLGPARAQLGLLSARPEPAHLAYQTITILDL